MFSKLLAGLVLIAVAPSMALAAWQVVTTDQGKRVEIDRESIAAEPDGAFTARGRIVLEKPIVDPKTSASYRIIEVLNRYDCAERTMTTLKRSYYKEEGALLRQEEVRHPFDMPVRTGTPDDRMMREVCRPKGGATSSPSVSKTLDKVSEVSGDLRKANEALVEQAVRKDMQRLNRSSSAPSAKTASRADSGRKRAEPAPSIAWSYEGSGAPDHWSRLRPEYGGCAAGRRQSPIDIRDGIAVDLEPIQFFYKPAAFRVTDSLHSLRMTVYNGGMMLQGRNYELDRIEFHQPSEFTVDGKAYDMEAQLVHRSVDGRLAIVSVFLEKGTENAVVQAALNNLPLEKGGEVVPYAQSIDINPLLPSDRRYFTFMGSLTTPPCTEDVLWLVLKQPQQVSPEQLSIFRRLYRPNARPVQPGFDRIIKESRQ